MAERRLGHYEILGPLGAGGMGEVHRARDTRLKRDVAVKFLPQDVVGDPERLVRMRREAEALAAISHPNIATIHNIEEADGVPFLVLELVEGQTLAERLGMGALPVTEALDIARQVADALETAHARGTLHRDLKPANIMIDERGRVKVLDFGLAKPVGPGGTSEATGATTGVRDLTATGVVVGTAPYMSPEQIRGEKVDGRTDVWSFACLLYEMLTGRRMFRASTIADTMAAVLDQEPDWSLLPPETPAGIRTTLRRMTRKRLDRRLRNIGDARLEIEDALGLGGDRDMPSQPDADGLSRPASRRAAALPWAVGGLVVGVALGAVALWSVIGTLPTAVRGVVRLDLDLPEGLRLSGTDAAMDTGLGGQRPSQTAFALAPDGSAIVYAAAGADELSRLYLRPLSSSLAAPMPGTEGACCPVFSPDGQAVAFFADGALKSVPIAGGEIRTILANAPRSFGVDWGDNGQVVLTAGMASILFTVPASGGTAQALTELGHEAREISHRLPRWLPGGHTVLFTVVRQDGGRRYDVAALSLATGARTTLVTEASDARYLPTGHLLFMQDGALMAAPFDADAVEVTGPPVLVLEDVMQSLLVGSNPSMETAAAQYALSSAGDLAFATGGRFTERNRPLTWVNANREATVIPGIEGDSYSPRLSPDGQRLVYVRRRQDSSWGFDIWLYDLQRGVATPLTTGAEDLSPAWSPDGTEIAFSSFRGGMASNLFVVPADGGEEPERLTESPNDQYISNWSRDGMLLYLEGGDIWGLPMDEPGRQPRPLVTGEARETYPDLSPDGRWLAYVSDETGRNEVYVAPRDAPGRAIRVSPEEGWAPAWSRDGRSLFYRLGAGGARVMMQVRFDAAGGTPVGAPGRLFPYDLPGSEDDFFATAQNARFYDVAEDGRFVMVRGRLHPPEPATRLHLVLGWGAELSRITPSDR